jgi:phage protein U
VILGDFQFSVKAISMNSLSRSTEFKWVETERVGDLPYVQNLGIAKDNVEIEGVFFPKMTGAKSTSLIDGIYNQRFNPGELMPKFLTDQIFPETRGSYNSINDIRNSNLCKTANNLITDSGEILGKFVIVSITENQSYFGKDGAPQKVEFTLALKRTPGVSNSFVGVDGSNSIIDTMTNIARSYLKW